MSPKLKRDAERLKDSETNTFNRDAILGACRAARDKCDPQVTGFKNTEDYASNVGFGSPVCVQLSSGKDFVVSYNYLTKQYRMIYNGTPCTEEMLGGLMGK